MNFAPIDIADNHFSFTNISADNLSESIEPVNSVQNVFDKPIQIRDTLLNSLQGIEVIPIYDEDYKNEEIDEIISKLEIFSTNFMKMQTELDELLDIYNSESINTKDNIDKLNSSIQFMKTMDELYTKDTSIKEIVDKTLVFTEKISQNDKLSQAKKNYVEKRKQVNKYLYLIQKINQWNVNAICPICMKNKIDSYCNPCGHTSCGECLKRNSEIINNTNHNKCLICREYIMDIRKLYFI